MRLRVQKWIDHNFGLFIFFWIRPVSLLLGKLLRRDHDLTIRKHIVVMKLLGGGSLFVALPTLKAIRDRYPDQRITLVCTPMVRPFAELTGVFDDFAVIRTDSAPLLLVSAFRSLYRCFKADCLINFEIHSKMAGLFSLLTCSRNRIGFYMQWNAWKHGVTTHALFYNEIAPIHIAYEQVIHYLDANKPSDTEITAHLGEANGFRLGPLRRTPRAEIALGAFSSGLCPEREFLPDEWLQILQPKFRPGDTRIHLLGGPGDRAKADVLMSQLQAAGYQVSDHCGQLSLRDSVQVILDCDEFLTIDSGLNHVVRRLGVKITSYWGPTDPLHLLAPIEGLDEDVHAVSLFCSPCVHIIDSSPCQGNNLCLKSHLEQPVQTVNERGWLVHKAFRR